MVTVTEAQRESFVENGFMIIPGFLSAEELVLVRDACDSEVERVETEIRGGGPRENKISVLDSKYFIPNARLRRPELKRVILSANSEAVCWATLGETAYLHTEQFVVKMMGKATTFAWHQDSGYVVYSGGAIPHPPYVTCWIALDDMSEANGTISVLPFPRHPESHDLLEHTWNDDLDAWVGYDGGDPGDLVEVDAGTVAVFSSRLLHRSGTNTTDRPRRGYFMAFTPTLFPFADASKKGVYSQGDPLLVDGKPMWDTGAVQ